MHRRRGSRAGEGEVGIVELPACRVAKLHYRGPGEGIAGAYQAIYGGWLPDSGYQPADIPAFEIYHGPPDESGGFDMDVCVPVVPA